MKMKKILSAIITLALLASCFASMSVINVSAHQNYKMNTITFDETKADGSLLYATGNCDVAEGGTYKSNFGNVNYGSGTIGAGLSSTKYTYVDVKTAPDPRYGKSLYYYEWYEDGANQPYIQAAVSPNVVNNNANIGINGTVRITASLYTEKNESDVYCQRAIKLRTTTTGGYKESYPVLFSHEASKLISVFGKSSGKAFKADTWYDVDIIYNIDTSEFHAVILEDGKEYINMTGTSATPLINIGYMYIYHSPQDGTRNNIKVYWDNISLNSVDKFTISESDAYPLMDFEKLKDQEAGKTFAEGLPSAYSYSFGYQGNPELCVLKALETDKGKSACVYGEAYPGADKTSISVGRYEYSQVSFNTSAISQFHLKTSVKFKNTKLTGIYLNGQGSAEIMFYDNITAFGQTLFTGYDKTGDVWYDIDLIMDTETGYYDLTMVKTDDGSTAHITGFQTKYLTPITAVKFGHDRGSGTAATFVNESFYWIDDLYIGKYGVEDVGSEYSVDFNDGKYSSAYAVKYTDIAYDPVTVTAGQYGDLELGTAEEIVNATKSVEIPFIKDKPQYTITAKFTLEDLNSNKVIYFGNLSILEILTTGQVKCNQSARPKSEGFLVVGNEYTLTHTMQAGCSISSTYVSGVMDVNGTIKESKAGYGSGRPSDPWEPLKITVTATKDAEKQSTLTLSDIKYDVSYATSLSKDYKIESLVNAAPKGSIFIPHDKRGSGYIYTADVKFTNFDVQRSIRFGDNTPFATIDTNGVLTMGESTALLEADKVYELKITTNHGEQSTAAISFAGLEVSSNATPYINISQDMGAESIMSIDNVNFVAMIPFKVNSDEVLKNVHVSDDVTFTFSNALSENVTKDNFKVYAPTGTITDSALVNDFDVTVSEDRKAVTLSFAKTGSKHYHIAYTIEDRFGNTLTDWVEVNTAPNPSAGEVSVSVENRTATASFKSTGKEGNVFFAVALYADDELVALTPSDVTLSKADIEKEYKVSITAPDDGKTYTAKAFRWDASTQNPYEGAITASQTILAQ